MDSKIIGSIIGEKTPENYIAKDYLAITGNGYVYVMWLDFNPRLNNKPAHFVYSNSSILNSFSDSISRR